MAVVGGRPHHVCRQGAPLGAISRISPGHHRRISPARGGRTFLCRRASQTFVDETVKDQPFLVGDNCTIADIGCWGRMVFMSEGGFEIANWPYLEAWAGRLKAMPGFALPYDLIPSKDREFDPV
jgi:glutathione S-transferase